MTGFVTEEELVAAVPRLTRTRLLAFVEAELDAPLDVTGLAQEAGTTMREQVYATSLMAITVDTPAEQAYLDQLATALGLDPDTRAKLHASMGKTPPQV